MFDEQKGYVKNDEIHLEIDVKAENPKAKTKLICEYIGNYYDHGFKTLLNLRVLDFHQLMLATRTEIELENISWWITVLRTHFGYIGIKLAPKNQQKSFQLQAQMNCKIKSKNGTARSIDQTSNAVLNTSSYMYVKNIAYFDDLVKPEYGYIENGSITFEIGLRLNKRNEATTTTNDTNNGEAQVKIVKIECAICFEDIRDKEVSSLICGHAFCTPCIIRSLETRKKCPNATHQRNQQICDVHSLNEKPYVFFQTIIVFIYEFEILLLIMF